MRAEIYNPYLDTLGGGERYTIAFALALNKAGYEVNVQWKDAGIKNKLEERFGIKLGNIGFVPSIKRGDGYDVLFWLSDGSIPLLRARRNFLHFQFPFKDVNGSSLMNKMKLFRVEKVICNSYFTKSFIDEEYKIESIVIYPPVDVEKIKPKRKENIILYVGRFSQLTQAKGQGVLIDVFKKFHERTKGWRLVLVGGIEVGAGGFVDKLEKNSKGFPIEIIKSPSFEEIKKLYGKAKVFWSASGFGVSEKKNPKRVEHFGISVVEAMAAGCIPVVFSAGGPKEIIVDGINGFLWEKKTGLLKITRDLVKDPGRIKKISQVARECSRVYEHGRFLAEIEGLL